MRGQVTHGDAGEIFGGEIEMHVAEPLGMANGPERSLTNPTDECFVVQVFADLACVLI